MLNIIKNLDGTTGVQVEADIFNMTDRELEQFVRQIPNHHFLLLKNVPHDKQKLVEFADRIGDSMVPDEGYFFSDDDHVQITRVTNKRDDDGNKIGLFADLELCWHCNGGLRKNVKQITLMLYCDKPGDQDYGITGFCNTRAAYEDLPNDVKQLVDRIVVRHSTKAFTSETQTIGRNDGGYALTPEDPEYPIFNGTQLTEEGNTTYTAETNGLWKPLVATHLWNKTKSLYFTPSFICEWKHLDGVDFDEQWLWEYLYNHTYQDKYIYKHRWESGDFIINDQWHGMHNRTEVKGDRNMYRFCVDNCNIIAENSYENK